MLFWALSLVSLALPISATEGNLLSLQSRDPLCDKVHFVPGIQGGFSQHVIANFSERVPKDDVQSQLSKFGISISNYIVNTKVIPHDFLRDNVEFGNGTLNLKVNAFVKDSIGGAEILTDDKFKYASVRTVFKSTTTKGVVQGTFFYANDSQEIDWEILTSTLTESSSCVPAGIWATNQAVHPGEPTTHQTVNVDFNPADDFHEYRIDWTPGSTVFYIDGQLKANLTTNVPTAEGRWIWNTWSSGDPCWSNGPPEADALMQIKSIELFKEYDPSFAPDSCGGTAIGSSTSSAVAGEQTVYVFSNGTKVDDKGTSVLSAKNAGSCLVLSRRQTLYIAASCIAYFVASL